MHPKELKTRRKKLKISQEKLAALTCLSRFRIAMFEVKKLDLSQFEFKQISNLLRKEEKRALNQRSITY